MSVCNVCVTNSLFLLVLLLGSSRLLLVFLLPEVSGDESSQLGVGDLPLSLEAGDGNGELTRKDGGASWEHCDGGLELGNQLTSLLGQDGVASHQVVIDTFLNSDLGTDGILKSADGEGKGGEALVDLSKESSGLLELKVVLSVELSLEDGGTELALLGLAFTSRDVDVEADNIAWGELELLNLLVSSLLVNDDIVSIDEVLLDLV